MTLTLQSKISWLDKLWDISGKIIALRYQGAIPDEKTLQNRTKMDLVAMVDDLMNGFGAITEKLQYLNSEAAKQVYDWILENNKILGELFQKDCTHWSEKEIAAELNFFQEKIPPKIIHYFFYAAAYLYLEKDFNRASRAFGLLSLLYPRHAEFWVLKGLCEQFRKQPALALVSYTIALHLDPENAYPRLYSAECWTVLGNKSAAEESLNLCKPLTPQLEQWCQRLKNAMTANQNAIVAEPIANIHLNGMVKNPQYQINMIVEGLIPRLEMGTQVSFPLEKLADELQQFALKIDKEQITYTSFEKNLLACTFGKVSITLEFFQKINCISALFFLSSLEVGMTISQMNTTIREAVKSNPCIRMVYSVAGRLDQCQTPNIENMGIIKYTYQYNQTQDVVVNARVNNPSYGTENTSYEETREDSRERVSRLRSEDIIGKSILDFGCNEGGILFACKKLGAAEIIGVDLNHWCIEKANRYVKDNHIPNAHFLVGDLENRLFLSTLPMVDTVFLFAVLDSSTFVNKTAVIANISKFAKHTLYYQGHQLSTSHVPRMYEFLISTDFTRFEYLGMYERRVLMRFSREIMYAKDLPPDAITSDMPESELLTAKEIYVFTDSLQNPPFSKVCRLIQYVVR